MRILQIKLVRTLPLIGWLWLFGALIGAPAHAQPEVDPAAIAETVVNAIIAEDFPAAAAFFTDELRVEVPEAQIAQIWADVLAESGPYRELLALRPSQGGSVIVITLGFERQTYNVTVAVNERGRVNALFFEPGRQLEFGTPVPPPTLAPTNTVAAPTIPTATFTPLPTRVPTLVPTVANTLPPAPTATTIVIPTDIPTQIPPTPLPSTGDLPVGEAAPPAQPTLAPTTPPDPVAVAQQLVALLLADDFDGVFALFNPALQAVLSAERLAAVWDVVQFEAGTYVETLRLRRETGTGILVTTVLLELAPIDIRVEVDATGQVNSLFFVPAATIFNPSELIETVVPEPRQLPPPAPAPTATTVSAPDDTAAPIDTGLTPPYADVTTFTEQQVTVGGDPFPLNGALTLPFGEGPFPAVVLIGGIGPVDRDATIGPNKPLRDIAWGLANRGIAALRFDRRTFAYPAVLDDPTLTVQAEIIDDALAAVELLRRTQRIDLARIVVLGHDLGGHLAPRIGAADADIAGLIIMAGHTLPLQVRILAAADEFITGLAGAPTPDQVAELNALAAEAAAIDTLSAETPPDARFLDLPVSYWLDLRGYDPVTVAAGLPRPLLIMQPERDFEVTLTEDFVRWQAGFAGRANATLLTYPTLNHLFMPGAGISRPAEYLQPNFVAETVISDIAAWINALPG
ncbi:MAG: DUF3887 domain-containing protein [Chloroflexi bacterium]|nr:DUF3887 domain-containing protein [Chloroflexota bacterium]